MKDKRQFERFELAVPAKIEVGGKGFALQAYTNNISAGGAYFDTSELLKPGAKLIIDLVIKNKTLTKLTGTQTKIRVLGKVLRSGSEGMAVSFSGQGKIMSSGSIMFSKDQLRN